MKNTKLLSVIASAVLSVSAVSGLTANASLSDLHYFGFSDNGLPEAMTSLTKVEDFD
ncbi:MAG: hypothetical protein IJ666_00105 [Ruminococcus sp.]|nr:hypothetical protein [Ruminococcus sp.]